MDDVIYQQIPSIKIIQSYVADHHSKLIIEVTHNEIIIRKSQSENIRNFNICI